MTLDDAIKAYEPIAATLVAHAWKTWCRHWSRLWGDRDIATIGTGDINAHIAERRRDGKSEGTISSQVNTLRQIFLAVNQPWPQRVAKFKINNDRVRCFEGNEEFQLRRVMHPEDWEIVELAYGTGLRSAELWDLKKEDVCLVKGFIHVRCGKGGKSRRVPIGKTATRVLKKLLKTRQNGEYLIIPRNFEHYKVRYACCAAWKERVLRPAIKASGIAPIRFHDMRHEAATRMVRSGTSLYTVSKIFGHSNSRTTERYAHVMDKDLKAAVSKL